MVAKNTLAHSTKRIEEELAGRGGRDLVRRDNQAIDLIGAGVARVDPAVADGADRPGVSIIPTAGARHITAAWQKGSLGDARRARKPTRPLSIGSSNLWFISCATPWITELKVLRNVWRPASLRLRKYRSKRPDTGDRFLVQVIDDGRGIDPV